MNSKPSKEAKAPRSFILIANQPALDLANTLAANDDGPIELIPDFESFCEWLVHTRLLSRKKGAWLANQWSQRKRDAVLAKVKVYRGMIKNVVHNLQSNGKVPSAFIQETNKMLIAAGAVLGIQTPAEDVYVASWPVNWADSKSVLGVIAEQGMRLVCTCDPKRIRKCDGTNCVLVFYDIAKNNRRRWHSMDTCGNRSKVALHRERAKSSKKK